MTTATETITARTYDIDPIHSHVRFQAKHLGLSVISGEFTTFDGSFRVDPSDLSTLQAEATIKADSLFSGDGERDGRLRSEDFLDVARYPEIRFTSTGVSNVGGHSLTLTGELTIRGVTRPVDLAVQYLGEAGDPWGGKRAAFEARATIDRTDYGLTWNQVLDTGGLLVGETIELVLTVQGVRAEES